MKKFSFLALTCGIMLAACGSSSDAPEPTPQPTDPQNSKVEFTAYLNAPTRAADTEFESGDKIGVFAVESSGSDNKGIIGVSYNNYANNVQYSYDGSRFKPTGAGIQAPTDGKKLYYTAVYPYTGNAAQSFTFGVSPDQGTPSAYTGSDLCTASTNATAETVVDLQFNHRLSKIIINLEGDALNSSDIQVKVKNVYSYANVDLNNLTFQATGNRTDVICSPNGTRSFKVILPPQTISRNEKFFVITVNGADYTIDTQSDLTLNSGKAYEFKAIVDGDLGNAVLFTGDINPWNTDERINNVVPEDIQAKMGPYITIYKGNNPPNIEGTVFVNPFETVYCEDQGHGGYDPGKIVNSEYIRFSNQNNIYNTLDIDETNESGSSSSTGTGAFISGTGNNFTAFFNTVGQTNGISTKTALVISGTKTAGGVSNLRYAFIMVEKGSDPENQLMAEGVFRVFKDQDGMSEYTSWPNAAPRRTKGVETTIRSIFSNVK